MIGIIRRMAVALSIAIVIGAAGCGKDSSSVREGDELINAEFVGGTTDAVVESIATANGLRIVERPRPVFGRVWTFAVNRDEMPEAFDASMIAERLSFRYRPRIVRAWVKR